jgi:hypothetical protein
MAQLKDQYFQITFLGKLAQDIESSAPEFSAKAFLKAVQNQPWIELELMDRMKKGVIRLRPRALLNLALDFNNGQPSFR